MSRSVLLDIARESIEEVLQAEQTIDRIELLDHYPVLGEIMATEVSLYLDNRLRGHARTETPLRPLLDDIIHNAKIAAFQDENFIPLVTSEYLRCTIELTLFSPDGPLTHRDDPILKE